MAKIKQMVRVCLNLRWFLGRKNSLVVLLVSSCYVLFMTDVIHEEANLLHKMRHLWINQHPNCTICPTTDPTSMSVDQRRRLALIVADVQREIHRLAGKEPSINGKWSVKLAAVAGELDPRLIISDNTLDSSARLAEEEPMPRLTDMTRHVCPEVYWGYKYDHPFYQHGMEPDNCTYVPKFSSVLTVILPAVTWKPKVADFVIKQIRQFYDIPIIAMVVKGEKIDKETQNITVIEAAEDYDEAIYMNNIVKLVETPYVLIGISLSHFSNQSSLERLVRVLDELEHVKVAGGAARDIQGRWSHGCLQQRMAVYQARYAMGYYYSKRECMYCDDLLTPFVTYKKLLSDVSFSKELSGHALYRDWFTRVTVKGHLSMSCPDVMFFVNSHVTMNNESWHMVAKKWTLEKIYSYDDQVYSFNCTSVGITCQNPLSIIHSNLLPQCCRAIMEKYLGYLDEFARKERLPYELQIGSALSAVKMGGYFPWDFDADIVFECQDYTKWMTGDNKLKNHKCSFIVQIKAKYVIISCPYFFLEIFCHKYNFTSHYYLPSEYQNTPTIINYAGKDLVVMANPGLYSRNKFGLDILKHAAHWRTLKNGKTKGYSDNPGSWNQCRNPEFHSCLDRYPGDGNLPFLDPFIHL